MTEIWEGVAYYFNKFNIIKFIGLINEILKFTAG
jgi:hypothetical protein